MEFYTLIYTKYLSDIDANIYLYSHNKTKAKVCVIKNDDNNKYFTIAFRTPPKDNTGVCHILEHSVLCGSNKYPIKDPYKELLKSSVNTFLNAMTYSDKTMYPCASTNDLDFKILMDVYLDAVFNPLIYKNKFRFSYELIIWASKGFKHTFNYDDMFKVNNDELEDVWTISAVQMNEKKFGYHPTQKPEELLERIIKSSSNEGDTVLDPFMGSGTTCYVAKKLNRNYIGIEKDKKFFNISRRRIDSI